MCAILGSTRLPQGVIDQRHSRWLHYIIKLLLLLQARLKYISSDKPSLQNFRGDWLVSTGTNTVGSGLDSSQANVNIQWKEIIEEKEDNFRHIEVALYSLIAANSKKPVDQNM